MKLNPDEWLARQGIKRLLKALDAKRGHARFVGGAVRDFTINALYADPYSGELFDYFSGLDDLKSRTVRFIGEPLQRIAEDHLRILRYFRFHARYGHGEPDPQSLEACTARANDLMALSRERIADELIKLFSLDDPTPTVRLMHDRGLFAPVVPEVADVERLAALVAYEREAGVALDPLRRLASLLPADPETATRVAARLKLSNKAKKRLASAADMSLGLNPRALAYRVGSETAVDRLLLAGNTAEAREVAGWTPPRLPITGGGLIARGVPEGPDVARTLRQIENAWVAAGFPSGGLFDKLVEDALG